jgi:hypothetical protein
VTDVEETLRAAMHAAADSRESSPAELIRIVVGRHRRRRAVIAGVAVLLAFAVAVPATVAVREATESGAKPAGHLPQPRPKPLPTKLSGQPLPRKLSGQPWPAGTNLRLLIDQGPALFSTATGRAEAIRGLPEGFNFFTRVQGGWTAQEFHGGLKCPPLCNEPLYFLADGSVTATRIGSGNSAKASGHIGSVWLEAYPPAILSGHTGPDTAQLVTTAGRLVGPQYRLPAGYGIDRGVGSYLLLQPATPPPPPYVYELWNPRTGKVIRRLDNVAAAASEEIAWSPGCRGCHLQILDIATDKTVTTPIPGGQPSGLGGTFTDDGRLLAVTLSSGAIDVFDTQRHTLTVIPGTIVANDIPGSQGWLAGSHRFLVVVGPPDSSSDLTQVAYWQPGDTRLKVATFSIPGGESAVVFDGLN